ncbi:MAG TPA: DUF4340 domain-containing protein [Gemmatimonadota bacterium]|nr:DUF4340 domain-containing protein [Gemmatimonadota bacterium]
MSERTLKGLVIVALVLVAAWGASAILGGRSGGGGGGSDSPLQRAFSGIREDGTASVELRRASDTLRLTREGGRWTVNGHDTDSSAVGRFWSAVDSARVTELAARNPSHHEALGVDESDALALVFRREDGDSVRVLLGKAGPYYPSQYARLPGEDAVWLVGGPLRREASRPLSDWRDRTVVRVDTSAVRAVSIVRHDTTLLVQRGDSAWTLDGRPVAAAAARGILAQLADLQASGFAPDSARPGGSTRVVAALGAGGDTLAVVRFSERAEQGYYASVPGRDLLFQLPAYRVDRVAPSRETLQPPDSR